MNCTKNPKKFLNLIPYNGTHDFVYAVGGWSFELFKFTATCRACGSSHYHFGIEFDHMVSMGFKPEFLRDVRYQSFEITEEHWQARKEANL